MNVYNAYIQARVGHYGDTSSHIWPGTTHLDRTMKEILKDTWVLKSFSLELCECGRCIHPNKQKNKGWCARIKQRRYVYGNSKLNACWITHRSIRQLKWISLRRCSSQWVLQCGSPNTARLYSVHVGSHHGPRYQTKDKRLRLRQTTRKKDHITDV